MMYVNNNSFTTDAVISCSRDAWCASTTYCIPFDATNWNSSPCPLLAPHVLDVTHQEGDHAAAAVSLSKLEIAAPKGSSGP